MHSISDTPLSISKHAQPTEEDKTRIALQYEDAVRIIQGQIQGSESLDRKTEHLVYVGLLGLAAAFAIANFSLDSDAESMAKRATFALVLAGVVANVVGLVIAAQAYAGLGKEKPTRADSPSIRDLSEAVDASKFPPWKYQTSVIHGLADAFDRNDEGAAQNVKARTIALWHIIGAAGAYAFAAAVSAGSAAF